MTEEQDLAAQGILYLSNNIRFRDMDTSFRDLDTNGKFTTTSPAVEYAAAQLRVISRVKRVIETDEGLQWLHDFLLANKLHKDTFDVFYKIWSREYNIQHSKKVSEVIWTNYKGIHSLKKDRSEEYTKRDQDQLKTLNTIFNQKKGH